LDPEELIETIVVVKIKKDACPVSLTGHSANTSKATSANLPFLSEISSTGMKVTQGKSSSGHIAGPILSTAMGRADQRFRMRILSPTTYVRFAGCSEGGIPSRLQADQ